MEARSSKIEDGSAVPRLEAKGKGTAGTDSEQIMIKVCTQLDVPCISRKGYTCLHNGPCQPCNVEGEVLAGGRWTAYPSRPRGSTA